LSQKHIDGGRYVQAYDMTVDDTLRIWVEHVPDGGDPSYGRAEAADRVVWCYPQVREHDQHLFPNAEGEIYVIWDKGMVSFYTESGVKASNMTDHVSSL
jgi:hypothetical protein